MKTKDLNLCEILKDCPKGTKLYSPVFGYGELQNVRDYGTDGLGRCIISVLDEGGLLQSFDRKGRMTHNPNAECCLFPSKDNRDWNTFKPKKERFDPKTLKPFDKVLVREDSTSYWHINFFEAFIKSINCYECVYLKGSNWRYCIPYNDETTHLVGTTDEAPEYYKWWEG